MLTPNLPDDNSNTVVNQDVDNNEEEVVNPGKEQYPSGDCMKTFSPENTGIQFYLAIGTFAAGLLMIIFLTTTIIMCCKYHHINGMISDGQQGNVSFNQDTDPVYVSLQKRSNYERVYMPFEEPKILRRTKLFYQRNYLMNSINH